LLTGATGFLTEVNIKGFEHFGWEDFMLVTEKKTPENGICCSIFKGIELEEGFSISIGIEAIDTVLDALKDGLFDTTKSQPEEETRWGRLMVCETQGWKSS
jgi:hypothetical protein